MSARVRVVAATDVLDVEDERVVLLSDRAVVLSAVAAVVHQLLEGTGWISRADLLARVGEVLPLPEDPEAALSGLLEQLAEQGIVELG